MLHRAPTDTTSPQEQRGQRWRICNLSGGVASWLAAKRTVERYGPEFVVLIFADTMAEEPSTYRFLEECVADIGPVWGYHILRDGRTPWQVFRDRRFLGNSFADPCSAILKRELIDRWVKARFTPENSVRVFGYDWSEGHRLKRLQKALEWPVEAPLLDPPYLEKRDIIQKARDAGLHIPLLYELGFEHNNCDGKCVKAGQAHYAKLYHLLPTKYAEAEAEEESLRELLGDVSILTDRTGGDGKRPLSLKAFRARIEAKDFDKFDFGSCSCFSEPTPEGALPPQAD